VALGLAGVVLASAIVLLAGPAWVYAGNADEFTSSARQILAIYWPIVVGSCLATALALALLPVDYARTLARILAVVGVVAWLQGTIFVRDFGTLDGQSWSIQFSLWQAALELAAIGIAASMTWLVALRAPLVVAAFMVFVAGVAASEPFSKLPSKPDLTDPDAAAPLFRFSSEKNILVVLLDGMGSEIFDDVVRDNPDIRAALDGFTYYVDTAGVGYTTVLSLPVIHSGVEYEPGKPIKQFYSETIEAGSFLNDLAAAGYETALVNPLYGKCPSMAKICSRASSILTTTSATVASEANLLLAISIFRGVPLPLKNLVYNNGKWRNFLGSHSAKTEHHSVEGNSMMLEFAAKSAVGASKPTAKFLHLLSTHMPVAVGANCEYIGEQKKTREGYTQQVKCAMAAFARFIKALRDRGIFDKTAIVLLSDHGSGQWKSTRVIARDEVLAQHIIMRANPTLAIKPIGADGDMRRDHTPFSLADVAAWVCRLTTDCSRVLPVEGRRIRRYRHYAWRDNSIWRGDMPVNTKAYLISGPVHDERNWSMEMPND
jgi:hypothetical protein